MARFRPCSGRVWSIPVFFDPFRARFGVDLVRYLLDPFWDPFWPILAPGSPPGCPVESGGHFGPVLSISRRGPRCPEPTPIDVSAFPCFCTAKFCVGKWYPPDANFQVKRRAVFNFPRCRLMIFVNFFENFWYVPGPFWDPFWGRFQVILGSKFWLVLAPFRAPPGAVLGSLLGPFLAQQ